MSGVRPQAQLPLKLSSQGKDYKYEGYDDVRNGNYSRNYISANYAKSDYSGAYETSKEVNSSRQRRISSHGYLYLDAGQAEEIKRVEPQIKRVPQPDAFEKKARENVLVKWKYLIMFSLALNVILGVVCVWMIIQDPTTDLQSKIHNIAMKEISKVYVEINSTRNNCCSADVTTFPG